MNFAGIGNQVAQMHLDIVGRRPGDAAWPAAIWDHLDKVSTYADGEPAVMAATLARTCAVTVA